MYEAETTADKPVLDLNLAQGEQRRNRKTDRDMLTEAKTSARAVQMRWFRLLCQCKTVHGKRAKVRDKGRCDEAKTCQAVRHCQNEERSSRSRKSDREI